MLEDPCAIVRSAVSGGTYAVERLHTDGGPAEGAALMPAPTSAPSSSTPRADGGPQTHHETSVRLVITV